MIRNLKRIGALLGILLILVACGFVGMLAMNQQVLDMYALGVNPILIFSICMAEITPVMYILAQIVIFPIVALMEIVSS